MAVPIRHGSKATGLLSIQSYTKNAYNRESLATLQALADYCGGALNRIRTEAALRESEDRFAAFISHLPGFTWIKDAKGRYLFLSKSQLKLAPSPRHWRGRTDAELWPPEMAAQYRANDRKVLATCKVLQTVEPYPRRGLSGCMLVSKFPIRDGSGAVTMVGGVGIDITERQEAEAQLERSKDQLRALAFRLQKAREDESRRIAREIHDVFGQALATLNLDVVWLGQTIAQEQDGALRSQLRKRMKSMEVLLHSTVNSVQRFCQDLRPAMLDHLGLAATLQWQAQDFEKRTRIRCQWKPKPETVNLNSNEATALFRIFQEALQKIDQEGRAPLEQVADYLVER
jgi:PAS domain S-box-containing protein